MSNTTKIGAYAEHYSMFSGNCACGFLPRAVGGEYFLREKRQTYK